MSNPHHDNSHGGHGGGGGFLAKYKGVATALMFVVGIIVLIPLAYFVIILNEETALYFLYFLYFIEFVSAVALVFLFIQLQHFRKEHLAGCHWIDHLFADKNGQGHGHGHGHGDHENEHHEAHEETPEELRFKKAMQHIYSDESEESAVGVIEMNSLLRDVLIKMGCTGNTLEELAQDDKIKKLHLDKDILLVVKVKNILLKSPKAPSQQVFLQTAKISEIIWNTLHPKKHKEHHKAHH